MLGTTVHMHCHNCHVLGVDWVLQHGFLCAGTGEVQLCPWDACARFQSDAGDQLVAAAKQFGTWDYIKIVKEWREKKTNWKTIPVGVEHHNSLAGRLIGMAKLCLEQKLHRKSASSERWPPCSKNPSTSWTVIHFLWSQTRLWEVGPHYTNALEECKIFNTPAWHQAWGQCDADGGCSSCKRCRTISMRNYQPVVWKDGPPAASNKRSVQIFNQKMWCWWRRNQQDNGL